MLVFVAVLLQWVYISTYYSFSCEYGYLLLRLVMVLLLVRLRLCIVASLGCEYLRLLHIPGNIADTMAGDRFLRVPQLLLQD